MTYKDTTIKRDKSAALFSEAKQYFPGGVNSPVRAFKSVSGPPLFIERGEGAYIWDVDGNRYLDFCGSWGPLILGHAHPAVIAGLQDTIVKGTSFGTPTQLGNELGKLIVDNHPYVEQIRFVSSGTEAVMSALRLARGVTGRAKIIKFEGCYHGHVDSLLVKAGSGLATFGESTSAGIPEAFAKETIVLPLNDTEALKAMMAKIGNEVAAIIIEPIPANNGLLLQLRSFLECLREQCDQYGSLLIFDEVISGFRVGFGGASAQYGIRPDILTFGKIIGGGMPVGAYAASQEIMQHIAPVGPVYQAGTLSANPVAMRAGYETLRILLEADFYSTLTQKADTFCQHIRSHIAEKGYDMQLVQSGAIFWLAFAKGDIRSADQIDPASMEHFKKLHHELLQRGIYLGPSGYEVGFVSAVHSTEDLNWGAEQICAALDDLYTAHG